MAMSKKIIFILLIFLLGGSQVYSKKGVSHLEKATFGGGCFWCMQSPYDHLDGVVSTTVGYMGGHVENPTYEQVSTGKTGHVEVIQVVYDPAKISYNDLLKAFWKNIDPTTVNGQFADMGSQYRTVIFYHSEKQRQSAQNSKEALAHSKKFTRPIATAIEAASTYYPAEAYHQQYYKKNPLHYNAYKKGSGREGYIQKTWQEH